MLGQQLEGDTSCVRNQCFSMLTLDGSVLRALAIYHFGPVSDFLGGEVGSVGHL